MDSTRHLLTMENIYALLTLLCVTLSHTQAPPGSLLQTQVWPNVNHRFSDSRGGNMYYRDPTLQYQSNYYNQYPQPMANANYASVQYLINQLTNPSQYVANANTLLKQPTNQLSRSPLPPTNRLSRSPLPTPPQKPVNNNTQQQFRQPPTMQEVFQQHMMKQYGMQNNIQNSFIPQPPSNAYSQTQQYPSAQSSFGNLYNPMSNQIYQQQQQQQTSWQNQFLPYSSRAQYQPALQNFNSLQYGGFQQQTNPLMAMLAMNRGYMTGQTINDPRILGGRGIVIAGDGRDATVIGANGIRTTIDGSDISYEGPGM